MKLLSVVPLIAASSSEDVYDCKTILSITSDDAFIEVRDVPHRLEKAKLPSNADMAAFLKTATIKTLKYSGLQVVSTSDDTVSSADLCAYLKEAASELPGLECECSPNFATKQETTDDDLGVNDPNALWQRAFKRMNMKEVWRLSRPYARRTIKVAVMDSGFNFTEIAPYRGTLRKKSGGYINAGWNFLDDPLTCGSDSEKPAIGIVLRLFMRLRVLRFPGLGLVLTTNLVVSSWDQARNTKYDS
ncbi:Suppressor of the cold-sensitive snRNP bioproteinsis mutant brr1-1 [Perkinsus olseni]|uniref:subtilisin n=1 Tax=Perkinsus olseni TaxID=32597 RepID=A0A7J6SS98_PEROL|nr:Suppressor of the cold-sensitive snRNP bioproteinsis mutant brr1-1 [Perkinsus olseni]KAF4735010.1 Suppressor of the cold-sensitive snRNP bioproteinsis mutant brr1-1 [Perkinsus olseni]